MVVRQSEFAQRRRAESLGGRARPLAGLLVDAGAVAPADMIAALGKAGATGAKLHEVIEANGLAEPEEVVAALAERYGVPALDRARHPVDPTLAGLLAPETCIRYGVLPWIRIGGKLVLAAASHAGFYAARPELEARGHAVLMAVASEADIHTEISLRFGPALVHAAETSVPAAESCRGDGRRRRGAVALGLAAAAVAALAAAPLVFFGVILAIATLSLVASQALRLAALLASRKPRPPPGPPRAPLPHVTLLVPLFREAGIAQALTEQLGRLRYPRAKLGVLLILEDIDAETAFILARAALPGWVRTVVVPRGTLRTKPRALNYALAFAKGEIIGVLNAEDAPAPDQIETVVAAFQAAPSEVACLQGILDFYNPKANWLSRCFAIEYATWFRLQLPGLARLGVPVPLGGTTVYFRRAALEAVRGWDAHNVTEDADLGIRLARHGYRTEMIPTVTREEANNRTWPWIKQRSRWLKGYAMTWAVHSRAPRRLHRDLGPWRALALQVLLLGTLAQALLAPALWSFWLILAGLPHPAEALLGPHAMTTLFALFIGAEGISILASLTAIARSPHDRLMRWVPGMMLYYPLGTIAAGKALWEVVTRPFYWEKTEHGRSAPDDGEADRVTD